MKKLKNATSKFKTCINCDKTLKKASKIRNLLPSAKTIFPTELLQYITDAEKRQSVESGTKVHEVCVLEFKKDKVKKQEFRVEPETGTNSY